MPTYLHTLEKDTETGGKYWRCYDGGTKLIIEFNSNGKKPNTREFVIADCEGGSIHREANKRAQAKIDKDGYKPVTATKEQPARKVTDMAFYGRANIRFTKEVLLGMYQLSEHFNAGALQITRRGASSSRTPNELHLCTLAAAESVEVADVEAILLRSTDTDITISNDGKVTMVARSLPQAGQMLFWQACSQQTLVQGSDTIVWPRLTQQDFHTHQLIPIAESFGLAHKPLNAAAFTNLMGTSAVF